MVAPICLKTCSLGPIFCPSTSFLQVPVQPRPLLVHAMTSEKRPLVVAGPSTSPPRKKTCRCGSSEHSRTTSKNCPLYTPRRAKQQQPYPPDPTGQSVTSEAPRSPRTIKCKLASIVRDRSIIPALENANERFNRQFRGAKTTRDITINRIRNRYAAMRPPGTPWTSDRYVASCFINVLQWTFY